MILMTARMMKILLLFAVMLGGFYLFRKRLSFQKLLYIEVLVVVFALFANIVAGYLPPLTDKVTLTALGECQEEAQGEEVFLAGYKIDGEKFLSGWSLEIEEGHWFWSGEDYAWRIETDTRQPEGMTRTVVLRIPVGWARTLRFRGGVQRGMVQISDGEETWIKDTYANKSKIISEPIARSETSDLIINQIRYLVLYLLILVVCSAIVYFTVLIALKNPKRAQLWLADNSGKLIYGSFSILIMGLMIFFANKYSLWLDELWEIYFVKGTLQEALQHCIAMHDIWPPLFTLSASIWYHIAPYGERWLLLITIIPSVFSIYLVGLIGEKLRGKTCGILASLLMGFSTTLWLNSAYEFRAYAFLIACSAMTLYCHIKMHENGEKREIALFSLALTALAMSHYFGMLCCPVFFFADVFLLWKKRVRWNVIISYLLPATASFAWLGVVYASVSSQFGAASGSSRIMTASNIASILRFLAGDFNPVYYILLIGLIISAFDLYKLKRTDFTWSEFYGAFILAMISFVIFFTFGFANFIHSKRHLEWERYYMALFPYVCVLIALTVYNLSVFIGKLQERERISQKALCTLVGIILCANCLAVVLNPTAVSALSGRGKNTTMPFREAANWIYKQSNDIFNKDTVIVSTQSATLIIGWDEYYITRQGRRDSLNHIYAKSIKKEEDILQYNRVYVHYNWKAIPSSLQNILNEHYTLETNKSRINVSVYTRNEAVMPI